MAEYRLEELAQQANTTVRNIRAYRDRKLLPPPRRQGRVAIYNDAHLGRLRLIADLLARGYTLGNIAELIAAWERGKDVADILQVNLLMAPHAGFPEIIRDLAVGIEQVSLDAGVHDHQHRQYRFASSAIGSITIRQ